MSSYTCSVCKYTTKIKGNLKQHIERMEECKDAEIISDNIFIVCKGCNKNFESELYYKQHTAKCYKKIQLNESVISDELPEMIKALNDKMKILFQLVEDQQKQINDQQKEINELKNNKQSENTSEEEETAKDEHGIPTTCYNIVKQKLHSLSSPQFVINTLKIDKRSQFTVKIGRNGQKLKAQLCYADSKKMYEERSKEKGDYIIIGDDDEIKYLGEKEIIFFEYIHCGKSALEKVDGYYCCSKCKNKKPIFTGLLV